MNILIAMIGVIAGAIGYWFSTFSIQPIIRYRDIKNQVLMDFIYYGQVINSDGLDSKMQELYRERVLANRKTSAQLSAAYSDLPRWYRCYLNFKQIDPLSAASNLIGFSNTTEYMRANEVKNRILALLGLTVDATSIAQTNEETPVETKHFIHAVFDYINYFLASVAIMIGGYSIVKFNNVVYPSQPVFGLTIGILLISIGFLLVLWVGASAACKISKIYKSKIIGGIFAVFVMPIIAALALAMYTAAKNV